MRMHKGLGSWRHMTDAVLSQANPVNGTRYTVLDTTNNVRLIGMSAYVTWAVTQPTPLQMILTIDGIEYSWAIGNPVSNTRYVARDTTISSDGAYDGAGEFVLGTTSGSQAFLIEGKSVRVQMEITWAVNQPTFLVGRVRYAVKS